MNRIRLPLTYHFKLHMVIPGQLPRKSNMRRIVRRGKGGPPMVIKSKEALAYFDTVTEIVTDEQKLKLGSLDKPLLIVANVYYKSRRPDLSIELLLDALEKAEVIKNDRYVREQFVGAYVDAERPRTELWLFEINHEREPFKIGGRNDEAALVYE